MPTKKARTFSAETKLRIVERMLAGEPVRKLAKELKVKRTFLYRWKDRYRKLGAAGFHLRRGRPGGKSGIIDLRAKPAIDPEAAARRIADLERKVGQQQLELDFFRQALRQVREARRPNDGPGASASTRKSKP
jgi:transposase-like protein